MSIPQTHKVILIEENSQSLDVLKYVDVPAPQIESGNDVIIKNKYAGVNFIEAYFRSGLYPSEKPYTLGREAAGVVAAVGKDVTRFKVGDNVVYLAGKTFAQYTKIPDSYITVTKLAADISEEGLITEAGAQLQGLTALSLVEEGYTVKKGDKILVWAAAGGVGKLLTQLVKRKGGIVLAVASSDAKLAEAKALGADYLINSKTDDVVAKVKEYTDGKGVEASYDSIGKDTFDTTFDSLRRKGTFVSFGNASGAVPPLSIQKLATKNIKIIRTTLFNYVTEQEEYDHYGNELKELIASGELKIDVSKVYPLEDYKEATAALEGRKTTGKLVLSIPQ
ncbi:probable quinone oxidoreductase [[Candida] railenensis]|uniref:Probable quinone oxidoreductase n=1 Tax=[Candida] railenensis TaxID=45579 RepID=A0A9P0QLM6_9ASCO|nr:probable quinone oxidoreductase [[Candida] railenensis]